MTNNQSKEIYARDMSRGFTTTIVILEFFLWLHQLEGSKRDLTIECIQQNSIPCNF